MSEPATPKTPATPPAAENRVMVTFRISKAGLAIIDKDAKRLTLSRTGWLRDAVQAKIAQIPK